MWIILLLKVLAQFLPHLVTTRVGNTYSFSPDNKKPMCRTIIDSEPSQHPVCNSNDFQGTVTTHKSLKCWYTNADSLSNKLDELKTRIDTTRPDIIFITQKSIPNLVIPL